MELLSSFSASQEMQRGIQVKQLIVYSLNISVSMVLAVRILLFSGKQAETQTPRFHNPLLHDLMAKVWDLFIKEHPKALMFFSEKVFGAV